MKSEPSEPLAASSPLAPPFSNVEWHLGYEVGYREGESSREADMQAIRDEAAASPLAWEPLRALVATWRARAKVDVRYGVDQALASDREYYGTVNAGFEARQCADELEALLPPAPKGPTMPENTTGKA